MNLGAVYLISAYFGLLTIFSNSDFNDIFPKLNLNQKESLINKNELFENRKLYISDIDLTNDYIRYIRSSIKEDEVIYDHKFYENVDHQNDYLIEFPAVF